MTKIEALEISQIKVIQNIEIAKSPGWAKHQASDAAYRNELGKFKFMQERDKKFIGTNPDKETWKTIDRMQRYRREFAVAQLYAYASPFVSILIYILLEIFR